MAVSEAQKRATATYEKKKYDKILVRFPKGTRERIEKQSDSLNAYIIQAVKERLEADEDETLQDILQDAQGAPAILELDVADEFAAETENAFTRPQNAPETAYTAGMGYMSQEERDKWANVQSVEELQAMIEAKREDEKRQQAEREQAKIDELEQERQENLSIMMRAIEKAKNAQEQRGKFDAEELENMENDSADFPEYSEENIKDVLRENGYFREHVASHVYKNAMIEKYGASNYNLFQKCLRAVEDEEKEAKRQETIARAITESNQ